MDYSKMIFQILLLGVVVPPTLVMGEGSLDQPPNGATLEAPPRRNSKQLQDDMRLCGPFSENPVGLCLNSQECVGRGGSPFFDDRACTNSWDYCCHFEMPCGSVMNAPVGMWQSAGFPRVTHDTGTCDLTVKPLHDVCFLRVEFLHTHLSAPQPDSCAANTLTIYGQAQGDGAPLCGALTEYFTFVEVGRAIVDDRREPNDVYFLLSVKDSTHRFRIHITQIKCSQVVDFVPGPTPILAGVGRTSFKSKNMDLYVTNPDGQDPHTYAQSEDQFLFSNPEGGQTDSDVSESTAQTQGNEAYGSKVQQESHSELSSNVVMQYVVRPVIRDMQGNRIFTKKENEKNKFSSSTSAGGQPENNTINVSEPSAQTQENEESGTTVQHETHPELSFNDDVMQFVVRPAIRDAQGNQLFASIEDGKDQFSSSTSAGGQQENDKFNASESSAQTKKNSESGNEIQQETHPGQSSNDDVMQFVARPVIQDAEGNQLFASSEDGENQFLSSASAGGQPEKGTISVLGSTAQIDESGAKIQDKKQTELSFHDVVMQFVARQAVRDAQGNQLFGSNEDGELNRKIQIPAPANGVPEESSNVFRSISLLSSEAGSVTLDLDVTNKNSKLSEVDQSTVLSDQNETNGDRENGVRDDLVGSSSRSTSHITDDQGIQLYEGRTTAFGRPYNHGKLAELVLSRVQKNDENIVINDTDSRQTKQSRKTNMLWGTPLETYPPMDEIGKNDSVGYLDVSITWVKAHDHPEHNNRFFSTELNVTPVPNDDQYMVVEENNSTKHDEISRVKSVTNSSREPTSNTIERRSFKIGNGLNHPLFYPSVSMNANSNTTFGLLHNKQTLFNPEAFAIDLTIDNDRETPVLPDQVSDEDLGGGLQVYLEKIRRAISEYFKSQDGVHIPTMDDPQSKVWGPEMQFNNSQGSIVLTAPGVDEDYYYAIYVDDVGDEEAMEPSVEKKIDQNSESEQLPEVSARHEANDTEYTETESTSEIGTAAPEVLESLLETTTDQNLKSELMSNVSARHWPNVPGISKNVVMRGQSPFAGNRLFHGRSLKDDGQNELLMNIYLQYLRKQFVHKLLLEQASKREQETRNKNVSGNTIGEALLVTSEETELKLRSHQVVMDPDDEGIADVRSTNDTSPANLTRLEEEKSSQDDLQKVNLGVSSTTPTNSDDFQDYTFFYDALTVHDTVDTRTPDNVATQNDGNSSVSLKVSTDNDLATKIVFEDFPRPGNLSGSTDQTNELFSDTLNDFPDYHPSHILPTDYDVPGQAQEASLKENDLQMLAQFANIKQNIVKNSANRNENGTSTDWPSKSSIIPSENVVNIVLPFNSFPGSTNSQVMLQLVLLDRTKNGPSNLGPAVEQALNSLNSPPGQVLVISIPNHPAVKTNKTDNLTVTKPYLTGDDAVMRDAVGSSSWVDHLQAALTPESSSGAQITLTTPMLTLPTTTPTFVAVDSTSTQSSTTSVPNTILTSTTPPTTTITPTPPPISTATTTRPTSTLPPTPPTTTTTTSEGIPTSPSDADPNEFSTGSINSISGSVPSFAAQGQGTTATVSEDLAKKHAELVSLSSYHGTVMTRSNADRYGICSTALISSRYSLTAASCVLRKGYDPDGYSLLAFFTSDEFPPSPQSWAQLWKRDSSTIVSRVMFHPMFDASSWEYDIAVLRLAKYVLGRTPIALPSPAGLFDNIPVIVIGLGMAGTPGPGPDRLGAKLSYSEGVTLSHDVCHARHRSASRGVLQPLYTTNGQYVRDSMICVDKNSTEPTAPCQSQAAHGNLLVADFSSPPVLVGIMTGNPYSCDRVDQSPAAELFPDVAVRITAVRSFINAATSQLMF